MQILKASISRSINQDSPMKADGADFSSTLKADDAEFSSALNADDADFASMAFIGLP